MSEFPTPDDTQSDLVPVTDPRSTPPARASRGGSRRAPTKAELRRARRAGGGGRSSGGGGRAKRGLVGILVIVLAVVLGAGALFWGATQGVKAVQGMFAGPEDFSGTGNGDDVLFEVAQGDTASAIGRGLKEQGVVASVQAFIDAANADPASSGIQVGHYALKPGMSAQAALDVLANPANKIQATVTVPEGLRVEDVVDLLVKKTDFTRGALEKALRNPDLGLPEYAEGNPEGYLFPATYAIAPGDTALDLMSAMVERWGQAAREFDLENRAAELGKTPQEIMTIASLVEAEGRGDAMAKIARVIYNRLDGPGNKGGTNGLLQIDAAVNYALGQTGTTEFTEAQKASVASSPYNTYYQVGLPPTPIEAPGDDAIEAALNPAEGDWYYYVTVDLETGETRFSENYSDFLVDKAAYKNYCLGSDRC
ncbi:endolytic transglycosylase MltG [Nocardioides yefusunii]|uniref:Endolytic murein transglycosylase n=1 Tax=Nocardioides yefusunii TaxID=2500546 RepID=A0ABW1R280_9ACTN|nr:endolytic transglycosylase MltG [Nocardioides yefusunii]